MAVKVSSEWLNACSGCEISILNIGDAILELIPEKIELVHIPALVDSKYFGPRGDGDKLTLPKATVGLVSGAVRNAEHKEVLEEMRDKVDILAFILRANGLPVGERELSAHAPALERLAFEAP